MSRRDKKNPPHTDFSTEKKAFDSCSSLSGSPERYDYQNGLEHVESEQNDDSEYGNTTMLSSGLERMNRRPSGTQVSVAATLLLGILTFGIVFGPRKGDVAQAADPQGGSKYDKVARSDQDRMQLSRDIPSLGTTQLDASKIDREAAQIGRTYLSSQQTARMDRIQIGSTTSGTLALSQRPSLRNRLSDRFVDLTQGNNYVFYTINAQLQRYVEKIVDQAQATHVAIVAMNPKTGAILALAGKSQSIPNIEYHAGFPAASLFKVVTASAAVEHAGIEPSSLVSFRGGTYTLSEDNYLPNEKLDRRSMTVAEALGRSCNPVFGHIGLRYLNSAILSKYTRLFGFNQSLGLEAPLAPSTAFVPADDMYEFSRTSAGFGEIHISPIHAAVIMSGLANGGLLPRPQLVEKVVSPDGAVLHRTRPEMIQRIVKPSTASTLLEMMHYTTTIGTSRREFMAGSTHPTLGNLEVAAKTGTLKGTDPIGLNNWFIAAAPISNPELAIAVITVDPRPTSKASHLGRKVLENYFNISPVEPLQVRSSSTSKIHTKHHRGSRSIVAKRKAIKRKSSR